MFIRVGSDPRILNPVYPIPFPASVVLMSPGTLCKTIGRSMPVFLDSSSTLLKLVVAKPDRLFIRVDFTITSFKAFPFGAKENV